jgi:hypothetical protein
MPSRFKASISPMLGSPARVAEGICDAIEESEQGCDVNSFRNLSFFPSSSPQRLNIVRGGSVSSVGD